MADESWSAAKPIIADESIVDQDDDEIKDAWDDESESEKEEEVKPPPPKPKKKEPKMPVEPEVDLSKMSSKEREEYLARKEMETYGMGEASVNGGGASLEEAFNELRLIDSKNVKEKAAEFAKKVMSSIASSEQREFLLHFCMEACNALPSKDQRHISTTIKTAADLKKEEEDKAKKAGGAKSKKPTTKIASKAMGGDMFDDFKTAGNAGGTYNEFDDDFM